LISINGEWDTKDPQPPGNATNGPSIKSLDLSAIRERIVVTIGHVVCQPRVRLTMDRCDLGSEGTIPGQSRDFSWTPRSMHRRASRRPSKVNIGSHKITPVNWNLLSTARTARASTGWLSSLGYLVHRSCLRLGIVSNLERCET
jgi:hypothetical protein